MDLIDIYRTFHPKAAEYTSFSSAQGTSSRIDHILGHKSSLGKFKKIEGVPVMVQWLTNPTRNHKVSGLVPGLAQWVKDPALP